MCKLFFHNPFHSPVFLSSYFNLGDQPARRLNVIYQAQKMLTAATHRAAVLFDGNCAFCRRSVALLKQLDWCNRLTYVDIRAPGNPLLRAPVLKQAPLMEEMHVITADGTRLYHGFGALRWLAWRLPALWLIAPCLHLPGIPPLGQRLYLWIARNRFRIVPCHGGICTIQRKDASTKDEQ
jgi:predicted DCC family thiol-disulfide oxidoreductase YuxK